MHTLPSEPADYVTLWDVGWARRLKVRVARQLGGPAGPAKGAAA